MDVPAVPIATIADAEPGEPSASVEARVRLARTRQQDRYGATGPRTNASVRGPATTKWCRTDHKGRLLLRTAAEKLNLTARGYDRVLKVARTIADLAGATEIDRDHIAEALQFRLVE